MYLLFIRQSDIAPQPLTSGLRFFTILFIVNPSIPRLNGRVIFIAAYKFCLIDTMVSDS